jgi:hypothetical protein
MLTQVKKTHPALKHGGYAATTILPGEDLTAFKKLHRELIAELSPQGTLECDVVGTLARLLWRKQNLTTFRVAELAQEYRQAIQSGTYCRSPSREASTVILAIRPNNT